MLYIFTKVTDPELEEDHYKSTMFMVFIVSHTLLAKGLN